MSRRLPISLALLFSGLAPAPAAAQDYVAQVWTQLREVESGNPDYELHHYLIATMEDGDSYGFSTPLTGGIEYVAFAACDEDCTDVDLRVKDAAGNVIATDTGADDTPFVAFVPPVSAQYRIEVEMFDCAEEYCYFGFGVLEGEF